MPDSMLRHPSSADKPDTLVIACGALAKELLAAIRLNRWSHLSVTCLPAILHNRPERITEAVRGKIRANRTRYRRILCLYGDCGTGGRLDEMLAEEGVERIEGAHCYAFYAGLDAFDQMMEEEIGTFFLTDYLVRFFDRLVMEGLGLDRHPELLADYFGNYAKVVWLAQAPDADLERRARGGRGFARSSLGETRDRLAGSRRLPCAPNIGAACRDSPPAPLPIGAMAQLIIAYWRDIPAQVTASPPGGRRSARVKRELSPRFAQAIDMAAMRSSATGTDAYLADWRQGEPAPCGEDLEAAVLAEVERLEREYDDARLRALIECGGREKPPSG